jgi:hypothetical protein
MLFGGVSGFEYRMAKKKSLSQQIFSIISKIKLQDSAVRFRGLVAVFFIQKETMPLFDLKLLQSICIKDGFVVKFEAKELKYR